jgi:hypothetical protein
MLKEQCFSFIQALSWHVLVHKKPFFILEAVPDKFHKMGGITALDN